MTTDNLDCLFQAKVQALKPQLHGAEVHGVERSDKNETVLCW